MSRHQPLNGADSAQSLADAIALLENAGFYVYPNSTAITPSCIACSEPALPADLYCKTHRLRAEEEEAL
jgi:hypothetical protein